MERGLYRSFKEGRVEDLQTGLVHAVKMSPADVGWVNPDPMHHLLIRSADKAAPFPSAVWRK